MVSWRYLLPFVPALLILVLIIFAFPYAGLQPYDGFLFDNLSYRLYDVIPGGPASRAGLQIDDQIILVDGAPIKQMSPIYGPKKAGDVVVLSILRKDQPLVRPLVLSTAPLSVTVRRLEPLLIALSCWLVAVIALAFKPTAREMQLFFLFLLAGAGALAAGELSTFQLAEASQLFSILLTWISPLLIHFHASFPQRQTVLRRSLSFKVLYGLALIFSLPHILWSRQHLRAVFWYPWLISGLRVVFALSALVSVGLLWQAYRTARDSRIRRQVRLIVLGTAWAFAPLVFLSLLTQVLTGSPLIPYEVSFLTLPLIPLSYAVSIYRHNLLDIDRFLNHSLVQFILGVSWISVYLLLVAVLNLLRPGAMLNRPLLGALGTLFMASTLVSLRQRIQRWVDRLFYGGWYDYRSVVTSVSTALSEARDESDLIELLIHPVTTTMGLKGAALFLANSTDDLTLRGCTGFGCSLAQDASLSTDCFLRANCPLRLKSPLTQDGPLVHLLRQEARPLENSDLQRQLEGMPLSDAEQAWLETEHVKLWLPLVFKDSLRGLLLMGGKEGSELFNSEDLRILETLAHQAALTAENIHLLGSLRRRADELGYLRDELEVANRSLLASREDERKMLARELHDQLLQDIFALNIGLQATMGMVGDGPLAEHLAGMHQEVLHLADEVRRLCTELRPPSLSVMGLADSIRSYTVQLSKRRGNIHVVGGFVDSLWEDEPGPDLIITLDLAKDRKCLDERVAIALFRVYQEALLNVEKHADAQNVWVQERLNENKVELSINDDGCGFVAPTPLSRFVHQGHFGLLGGQERMAAVGGGIRITSELEEGTELLAWAPANKKEAE